MGHWWTPVRFLDSAENDVITAVDRRLSSWGNISKSRCYNLETGHGEPVTTISISPRAVITTVDSGEQVSLVLESL